MKRRFFGWVFCAALMLGEVCKSGAQVTNYAAFRMAYFHQTTNAVQPVAPDSPKAYVFRAQLFTVNAGDAANVLVKPPGNRTYNLLSVTPTEVDFDSSYAGIKSLFDTLFPSGTYQYTINSGATAANLTVPAVEMYPGTIPYFTSNTWNLMQAVDPANALNVTWNGFTKDAGADSAFALLRILDEATGNVPFSVSLLPPGTTNYTVPAGTLKYGLTYRAELTFSNRTNNLSAGFGSATATAGYDYVTYASLVTPLPTLKMTYSAPNLILKWPAVPSGFVLESATQASPTAVWTTVSNVVMVAGQPTSTNSISGAGRFFRLRKGP
jgi:hypothetical protein